MHMFVGHVFIGEEEGGIWTQKHSGAKPLKINLHAFDAQDKSPTDLRRRDHFQALSHILSIQMWPTNPSSEYWEYNDIMLLGLVLCLRSRL